MSRRSRLKKKLEKQQRSQVALQADPQQDTIGTLVRNLCMANMNGAAPPQPQQVVSVTATWPSDWPTCPETCDINEWQRALQNRDYYLQQQKQDGGKKPWFQYPRQTLQYSEFVFITPDMARALLEFNPLNRKVKNVHVEGLSRDIINNRWLQTHESIAVNKLGNMHDGQHRGHAIIRADKGWPIYVTWNVPPEGIYATDSGDKRLVNEKLMFLFPDLKMSNKSAAIARNMMWGLANRGIRYTESEIANFIICHDKAITWVTDNMKTSRSELMAVMAKALLWWGEEIVRPFVERLGEVQFTGPGDPAKALYMWLQAARAQGKRSAYVSPLIFYKKALAAIHAAAMGREAKRIIAKEKDVFEWLPGWAVPEDAPCGGKVFLNVEQQV